MALDQTPLEDLEARKLLSSVTVDHSRLIVVGDLNTPNVITVRFSRGGDSVVLVVNGVQKFFDKNDINRVDIFGGNVNDDIEVLQTRNLFDIPTTLRGGSGNDLLIGSTESDLITGDNGNDTIMGGPQDDTINGQDTLMGGNGSDTIIADADTALVFGGRGNDVITGTARHGYIWGNEGNDIINMSGDHLVLLGNAGDDSITGASSNDTVFGGGGADVYHGVAGTNGEIGGVTRLMQALLPRIPTVANP